MKDPIGKTAHFYSVSVEFEPETLFGMLSDDCTGRKNITSTFVIFR